MPCSNRKSLRRATRSASGALPPPPAGAAAVARCSALATVSSVAKCRAFPAARRERYRAMYASSACAADASDAPPSTAECAEATASGRLCASSTITTAPLSRMPSASLRRRRDARVRHGACAWQWPVRERESNAPHLLLEQRRIGQEHDVRRRQSRPRGVVGACAGGAPRPCDFLNLQGLVEDVLPQRRHCALALGQEGTSRGGFAAGSLAGLGCGGGLGSCACACGRLEVPAAVVEALRGRRKRLHPLVDAHDRPSRQGDAAKARGEAGA